MKLVRNDDPRQLYEEILGAAIDIAHADGGTIQLLDERTRELSFAAIRGIEPALTSQFEHVDAELGLALRHRAGPGRALFHGIR